MVRPVCGAESLSDWSGTGCVHVVERSVGVGLEGLAESRTGR